MKKISALDKGQLFKNERMEFLTRTPVWFSIIFYSIIWFSLIWLHFSLCSGETRLYFAAIAFWTLFEYLAHRYLFHFVNESPKVQRFHYMIHGIHHEYPRDRHRLIMPPLPGLFLVLVLTGLFSLLFGKYVFIWMAGFINGWAIYVTIHFIVHAYRPVKPFRILWTHHAKHHYKDGNKAFGVSSPFWDWVFKTLPD